MYAVESTLDILAPVGRVWRVLVDLDCYGDWHPFVTLKGVAEPDSSIQMEHKTRIKSLPAINADAKIIRLDRQEAIAWQLGTKGLMQVEEGFDILKTEEGSRVTHRMRCSGLVSVLHLSFLDRRMEKALATTNIALSRFLARGTTISRYSVAPKNRLGRAI